MAEEKKLYNNYAEHLMVRYGQKVYKLPVNLPGSCPNRDGALGRGGCIFCDEEGAGFECLPSSLSILEQLEKNKAFFIKRFNAHKFIAYFQAYTNTYLPLESFKENILAAGQLEDLVGISISTRPDCISEDYLIFLADLVKEKGLDITIELGLQSVNYHTLKKINRGHTLAEFIDAVLRIKKYGMEICAHIILNLPWDNEDDVVENSKVLSALDVEYVKLHSLYVVKNTVLGQMYQGGEVRMPSLEEYVERVILFLEYLSPSMIIQRLVGKGPQGDLLFCNWDTSWWKIKSMIEERMQQKKTFQGIKFNYLNGKALLKHEKK